MRRFILFLILLSSLLSSFWLGPTQGAMFAAVADTIGIAVFFLVKSRIWLDLLRWIGIKNDE